MLEDAIRRGYGTRIDYVFANNEMGAVRDWKAVSRKGRSSTDAVQAALISTYRRSGDEHRYAYYQLINLSRT